MRGVPIYLVILMVMVGTLVGASGCAFTKLETARQLDAGEYVISGSADWPGYLLVVPRVQGNAMYGLGQGDVSVHLGNSLGLFNAGGGTRLYLTEWVNLSLQADAFFLLFGDDEFFGSDGRTAGFLTATPRLLTTADWGRSFYGGVQANILFPTEHVEDEGWNIEVSELFVLGGLVVGTDYLFETAGIGVQAEMIFYPVVYSRQQGFSTAGLSADSIGFPALGQVSLGGYLRPRYEIPPERLRPSGDWERWEQEEPRRPPERERPRRQEPDEPDEEQREPEYDDRGVPIY